MSSTAIIDAAKRLVWVNLAKHLSKFVKKKKTFIHRVYDGEVPSFGLAAILRVWSGTLLVSTGEWKIIATISITSETIWCSSPISGLYEVSINNPKACELTLAWMVRIGVAKKNAVWHDPD